jgi:hypothetical protein
VVLVWESADGEKSIDEIAMILQCELGIPADRDVVLLALEELESAGLLETSVTMTENAERPSRREIGRRLAMAGASAALLPFIASVLAPTPAMASSRPTVVTKQQYTTDALTVGGDILHNAGSPKLTPAVLGEYNAGLVAGTKGQYQAGVTDFNGVLAALGLPPLA